jgi:hypothetical protein
MWVPNLVTKRKAIRGEFLGDIPWYFDYLGIVPIRLTGHLSPNFFLCGAYNEKGV